MIITMDNLGWMFVCVLLGWIKADSDIVEIPADDLDPDLISDLNSTIPREKIELNTAWLRFKSLQINETVEFFWQHGECYECPLKRQFSLGPGENASILLQSSFYNELAIFTEDEEDMLCGGKFLLKERGDYVMIIDGESGGGDPFCQISLLNNPYNFDLIVLYAFVGLIGLAVVHAVTTMIFTSKYCQRVCFHKYSEDLTDAQLSERNLELESHTSTAKTTSIRRNSIEDREEEERREIKEEKEVKKERLRSLDAFRGLNLLLMIFVNYGGGGYWYFDHAVWNGLYFIDLIFPWFIFIMGTSMSFGVRSILKKKTNHVQGLWRIIWRSVKLFAAGIIYNTKYSNDMANIRLTGVLQRLAIVYLITAIIHYVGESFPFFMKSKHRVTKWWRSLSDLLPYFGEWITMLVLLGVFCYFTYWFPIPGCEPGYVGPGGLHENGAHEECSGGAALYIDLKVYTNSHIFQWSAIRSIYETGSAFDPEGFLGTFTSVFLCFLGLQAGKILLCHQGHRRRLARWIIWAVITGGIGTLLCNAKVEGGWVPINKNLSSISFVFISAGTGFVMLSIMYIIIDSWRLWNGQPFTYVGMNSIVLYMCHSIFRDYFPVSWQMPDTTEHWQLLLLHLWGTFFWVGIAYHLYRKKIFIAL